MLAYSILINEIARHFSDKVMVNKGVLVADVYNFKVERINDFMHFFSTESDQKEHLQDKDYLKELVCKGVKSLNYNLQKFICNTVYRTRSPHK